MAQEARPWPPAPRPTAVSVEGRREVIEAAAAGDVAAVSAALAHPEDRVRASAVRALARLGALDATRCRQAATDTSARARRAIAEAGAIEPMVDLAALLEDDDPSVVEVAAWAAGERGDAGQPLVVRLGTISAEHPEALCREAAVAALGAIGDEAGLGAILAAMDDRATVRRRAVLALAPFDHPDVTAALQRALADRDWQVRQAAEDLA